MLCEKLVLISQLFVCVCATQNPAREIVLTHQSFLNRILKPLISVPFINWINFETKSYVANNVACDRRITHCKKKMTGIGWFYVNSSNTKRTNSMSIDFYSKQYLPIRIEYTHSATFECAFLIRFVPFFQNSK